MHLVDVDVVGLQTTQRVFDFLLNACGGSVAVDVLVLVPFKPDLRRDDDPVAPSLERAAHDLLGMALSVGGRRVDERYAGSERAMNCRNGGIVVWAAPHPPADGPGAQADPRCANFGVCDLREFHFT
jgi:hypothetical protein